MLACNNFLFCAFVTMFLLDFNSSVAESCYSTGFWCAFSWLWANQCFFELPILILLVLYLIRSVSAEVSLNCIFHIRFECSVFWPWENQYMIHGLDSIIITQFPAVICSVSAEGFLNRVAQSIEIFLLLTLSKSFLFNLCPFSACLSLSSAYSYLARFHPLTQSHDIEN